MAYTTPAEWDTHYTNGMKFRQLGANGELRSSGPRWHARGLCHGCSSSGGTASPAQTCGLARDT